MLSDEQIIEAKRLAEETHNDRWQEKRESRLAYFVKELIEEVEYQRNFWKSIQETIPEFIDTAGTDINKKG